MKLKWPFGHKEVTPPAEPEVFDSGKYWTERYQNGRNSGSGSYGRLAEYKAETINALVAERGITSVVELGSGDGNQASLFDIPTFTGIDISPLVVERANKRFADRSGWRFVQSDRFDVTPRAFDMAMSLDVIYHLVEDAVFDQYMRDLTTLADKYVLVYASDHDEQAHSVHVRHRAYSTWMTQNAPQFELTKTYQHPYPMEEGADVDQTSFAFFRLFRRSQDRT